MWHVSLSPAFDTHTKSGDHYLHCLYLSIVSFIPVFHSHVDCCLDRSVIDWSVNCNTNTFWTGNTSFLLQRHLQ